MARADESARIARLEAAVAEIGSALLPTHGGGLWRGRPNLLALVQAATGERVDPAGPPPAAEPPWRGR